MRATSSSPDMPTPWMGGVCSGLAVHLGIPVLLVRLTLIGFTVLTIFITWFFYARKGSGIKC